MTRQTRTFVVLAVAVVAATMSAWGVYRAVSSRPAPTAAMPTVGVVVAAEPMPVGTLVTSDRVKVVAWPKHAMLPDSFADPAAVVDRGVIVPLAVNEPLTAAKLAPLGAGAGLPPSIPPGMRALSVKVNEVIGVAGFAVPGTRVDVLAVLHPPDQATRGSISRVVVGNVQVLSAGTRYDQEAATKEGKAIPSTVVTLLVTPDDAQRVTLAQQDGSLMLALRHPLDTTVPELKPVAITALIGAPAAAPVATTGTAPARPVRKAVAVPAPPVAPPPPPEPPKPYTVTVIRAAKATEEVVR